MLLWVSSDSLSAKFWASKCLSVAVVFRNALLCRQGIDVTFQDPPKVYPKFFRIVEVYVVKFYAAAFLQTEGEANRKRGDLVLAGVVRLNICTQ